MPVQSSTRFPYVALIISLISQHVMMGDICMNIGADQEIGKKLPVSPFMVLYEIGLHLCFRECESYAICLSINFNIKMLMCEMSSQKRNESLSLVNDSDFIYQEIPGVLDYRDKKCGSLPCNQNSKCVRRTSSQYICIAIEEPKSCMDILRRFPDRKGQDDIYTIVAGAEKKSVLCDMSTDQGGWTVIHRRQNMSIDFFRKWNEYRVGFGVASSNYWIGNDAINALTTHKDQELRVDLESFEGDKAYALYSTFYVEDVNSNYRLHVSGFSGTAGDSLAPHNGMEFSTYDNDNDNTSNDNCALSLMGAWWYNDCHLSNLNGRYGTAPVDYVGYMSWYSWKQQYVALKRALMMIRAKV